MSLVWNFNKEKGLRAMLLEHRKLHKLLKTKVKLGIK